MLRRLVLCGVAVCVSLFAGCEAALVTAPVHGKVTVDGKPAERGVISFTASDPKTLPAELAIQNGEYKGDVPPGPKAVSVRVMKKVGEKKEFPGSPDSAMREEIREVHLDASAASLSFDVPAGGGEFNPPDFKSKK